MNAVTSTRARVADDGLLSDEALHDIFQNTLRSLVEDPWDVPRGIVHLLPVALDALDAWPEEPSLAWSDHEPCGFTPDDWCPRRGRSLR